MEEVWKDIKGYCGKYQISSLGHVKSLFYHNTKGVKRDGILKCATDKKGYLRCALSLHNELRTFKVHRLVALHFIPNPKEFPQVNHKNGNKKDNRVENLEWCDNSKNQLHAWKKGLNTGSCKSVIVTLPNGKILNFNRIIDAAAYFGVTDDTFRSYYTHKSKGTKSILNKCKITINPHAIHKEAGRAIQASEGGL